MSVVNGTSSIWPGAAEAFWPASRRLKRIVVRGRKRKGEASSVTRGVKRACLPVVSPCSCLLSPECFGLRWSHQLREPATLAHSRKEGEEEECAPPATCCSFHRQDVTAAVVSINYCASLSRGSWAIKGRCRSSVRRNAQSLARGEVACEQVQSGALQA